MYPVEKVEVGKRKLILMGRFSPDFAKNILIPEIEANCIQYHVEPWLIEHFQKNKFAENSLFFHHAYSYADIPIGQEYEIAARTAEYKWNIIPDSAIRCKSTVLCFFSMWHHCPLPYANHGHHELSLIQFQNGIPDMIYELTEITEKKPIEITQEICLCSNETFQSAIHT